MQTIYDVILKLGLNGFVVWLMYRLSREIISKSLLRIEIKLNTIIEQTKNKQ